MLHGRDTRTSTLSYRDAGARSHPARDPTRRAIPLGARSHPARDPTRRAIPPGARVHTLYPDPNRRAIRPGRAITQPN
jgi:hypothetical protein